MIAKNQFIKLAFLFVGLSSCIKEDISNIGSNVSLQPGYAIPIGTPEIKFAEYLNSFILQFPVDTTNLVNKNDLMQYENSFYQVPSVLSHTEQLTISLISLSNSTDYISAATFRTNAINKIPAKVQSQVYFINANGFVLDSLYTDGPITIDAAIVDSEGNVIEEATLWKHDTALDDESINHLVQTSYIKIDTKLYIDNIEGTLNRFYSDQDLWIQLGAKIKLDVNLNEF